MKKLFERSRVIGLNERIIEVNGLTIIAARLIDAVLFFLIGYNAAYYLKLVVCSC